MPNNPKHLNKIRIIAGSHRSRWIKFPDVHGLRPTSEFIREKVFNWLGPRLDGKKVLDLFAGSGIFAFESASRGAGYVVVIEHDTRAYNEIKHNRSTLGLLDVCPMQQNAPHYLQNSQEKFDVIFLDPPYGYQNWDTLLELLPYRLNGEGRAYIESNRPMGFPNTLTMLKQGKNGKSYYYLVGLIQ